VKAAASGLKIRVAAVRQQRRTKATPLNLWFTNARNTRGRDDVTGGNVAPDNFDGHERKQSAPVFPPSEFP
jgi:hypothetical protein